jgi:hypothetical protein
LIVLALLIVLILGFACYRCLRASQKFDRILHEELPKPELPQISQPIEVPPARLVIPRQLGRS